MHAGRHQWRQPGRPPPRARPCARQRHASEIARHQPTEHSDGEMRTFNPNARETNWLLIVGFLAAGEALYIRYLAIEPAPVSLACQAGQNTWLCTTFHLAIAAYNNSVFGWVAIMAAAL